MIRIAIVFVLLLIAPSVFGSDREWDEIEKILQRQGVRQKDTLELKYPRGDLSVKINKITLDPALGLTSRIIFKNKGKEAVIEGELVIVPEEVVAVTRKLQAEGLKVTLQYTRIKESKPRIIGLNFAGRGQAVNLVWAFSPAMSATGTPMGPPRKGPGKSSKYSWKPIEDVFGRQGEQDGQVLRFVVKRPPDAHTPRREVHGANELVFQMIGKHRAAATGVLALTPQEVDPVRATLTRQGITVTAVQESGLSGPPALTRLYFWGISEPGKLAGALKSAIQLTGAGPTR